MPWFDRLVEDLVTSGGLVFHLHMVHVGKDWPGFMALGLPLLPCTFLPEIMMIKY